ncbi:MAG: hypothetical protein H3Z53_12470, partial [archaeon]|nr:hypothetical protein [archaeon]
NFLLVPDWGATFLDHDTLDTSVIGGWTTTLEPRTDLEIDTQVGIGIVETYKDINGTIGLVVYGYSGQDTTWTSDLFFNFNNIPLFLDDGDGVIEWEDDNENGLLDPEDLEYDTRWVDKLHQEATGYWLGDDLMLGWMWLDNEGDLKWTFMPLIVVLQKENPGVTALVIEIYYDIPVTDNPAAISREELFSQDSHPVALIVEELGTISEKPQHPDP